MASGPITSWEIDGETVETVSDFIFWGSEITEDGDCSHEIKRRLLLGRKVMTNLDSILKSRDITLPTKVHLVKAMVFPVVVYGCESWIVKKAECRRIDASELWCWRRLLRVPWTLRRSNQSILKEISPGCSLEGMMLKLKLQYFGHLIRRVDSLEKSLMLPGLSRSENSISQSASGREICIRPACQEFRPREGTAVAKPEYEPMLSGQLVVRLFSMASRVCMSRGSAGSGVIGPVEAAIRTKLEQALNPEVLELRNESGGHAVPPGSETHFRVAVVSSRFEGLSPLQRHRLVHAALSEELAGPVHALAIQARTPAQWKENPQLDTSPPCLGGSKKSRN